MLFIIQVTSVDQTLCTIFTTEHKCVSGSVSVCLFTWTRSGVTIQVDCTTGVWCWGRQQVRRGIPGKSRPARVTPLARWRVNRPIPRITARVLYIWGRGSLEKTTRDRLGLSDTSNIKYHNIFESNISTLIITTIRLQHLYINHFYERSTVYIEDKTLNAGILFSYTAIQR